MLCESRPGDHRLGSGCSQNCHNWSYVRTTPQLRGNDSLTEPSTTTLSYFGPSGKIDPPRSFPSSLQVGSVLIAHQAHVTPVGIVLPRATWSRVVDKHPVFNWDEIRAIPAWPPLSLARLAQTLVTGTISV